MLGCFLFKFCDVCVFLTLIDRYMMLFVFAMEFFEKKLNKNCIFKKELYCNSALYSHFLSNATV